ncbi:MAG: hypothetical protein ABIP51_16895 [Bacteroidia bacterium]
MKFYKTNCEYLIQYNPDTKLHKIRNLVDKKKSNALTEEEFKTFEPVEIKRQEFSRLMNIFYKNIKDEWTYLGTNFRKLDNLEDDDWMKQPKHYPLGWKFGTLVLVYHWGRAYYFTWSYNGYPQGQLVDIKTMHIVRWARPKNCAPIFNEKTKEII